MSPVQDLTPNAYYLLTVMQGLTKDLNDEVILDAVGFGVSTYRKYKKELKDKGYLQVTQVGKSEYEYKVYKGHKNGDS